MRCIIHFSLLVVFSFLSCNNDDDSPTEARDLPTQINISYTDAEVVIDIDYDNFGRIASFSFRQTAGIGLINPPKYILSYTDNNLSRISREDANDGTPRSEILFTHDSFGIISSTTFTDIVNDTTTEASVSYSVTNRAYTVNFFEPIVFTLTANNLVSRIEEPDNNFKRDHFFDETQAGVFANASLSPELMIWSYIDGLIRDAFVYAFYPYQLSGISEMGPGADNWLFNNSVYNSNGNLETYDIVTGGTTYNSSVEYESFNIQIQ